MADELTTDAAFATFHCPWCSASLPSADLETCPSCDATLTGDAAADPSLPGLTAIDAAAIVRSKDPVKKPRNRILSWISGEYVDDGEAPSQPDAIAPPDLAVRREILRLEIEAEIADKQAEADSIMADAAVEGRPLPGLEPVEEVEAEAAAEDVLAAEAVPAAQSEPVSTDEHEQEKPAS